MALKTKTHDLEKVSTVQRTSQQTVRTASEHERPSHHAVDLQRAITSQPSALRPTDVFALQRTVGNRAVRQILQAKLAVGPANDHYEREADRVAASVMQNSGPAAPQIQRQGSEEEEAIQTKPLASSITPLIQRQEFSEGEENEEESPIQAKLIGPATIQRQETPAEEDETENPVQLRSDGGPTSVVPRVEQSIERARGGGQPLPDRLRSQMEKSFGADFGAVRVHTDSESNTLNRSLSARAFTTGHDLFFRRGEYNPDSPRGQELIAHELTHMLQQNGGKSGKKDLSLKRIIQRDWFDEERGFFNADPRGEYGNMPGPGPLGTRRENYNRDDKRDLGNYSLLGLGAVSAVAKGVTERAHVLKHTPKDFLTESAPIASKTGEALSWMGAIGAGAGTATSLVDAYRGYSDWSSAARTREQQKIGGRAMVSGLASATQQAATTTFHSANLVANPAMALTAQAVTGGAGAVAGAVDMVRGYYAYSKAKQNAARLQQLHGLIYHKGLKAAAQQAKSTQEMRQSAAKWTVGKGLLTAVGGGLLVATAATPVGWLLLGLGAAAGGIGALIKLYRKSKRKEEVAIRELGLTEAMDRWKADVEIAKEKTYWKRWKRSGELAKLGPSPLERKLKELNFISPGHFYANFIHKTANDIYNIGVDGRQQLETQVHQKLAAPTLSDRERVHFFGLLRKMSSFSFSQIVQQFRIEPSRRNPYPVIEELLAGMGLKFDFRKRPPVPKPETIGKALHD